MVKRDDNTIDATRGSVRDTARKPAEPVWSHEASETADLHEAHYRPEMGTIVSTPNRLKSDGR